MKPGTNFRQPQSEFNYIVERAPEKVSFQFFVFVKEKFKSSSFVF